MSRPAVFASFFHGPGAVPSSSPGEIASLNTLRGFAALSVVVYHGPWLFGVEHALPHAYLAVDLFFVLSGFVIAHVYQPRIDRGLGFARFCRLRMARLYPLVPLAMTAGFALWLIKAAAHRVPFDPWAFRDLFYNLLLLPVDSRAYVANQPVYPFAIQSWSILWDVLLCAAYYYWARGVRRGGALICLAAAVVLGWVIWTRGSVDGGWTHDTFWIGGVRALFGFSAGVIVRRTLEGRIGEGVPVLLRAPAIAAMAAVLAYVALVRGTAWFVDLALVIGVFPFLIATAAMTRSPLARTRIGACLGEASYSVYLLHSVAIEATLVLLKRAAPLSGTAALSFGLVWMAVFVGVCWLCWRYVETPLRRFFGSPRLAPRAPAPFAVNEPG